LFFGKEKDIGRGERRKGKKYIKYTVGISIESIRNMKIP
jgi:hypothetical protein